MLLSCSLSCSSFCLLFTGVLFEKCPAGAACPTLSLIKLVTHQGRDSQIQSSQSVVAAHVSRRLPRPYFFRQFDFLISSFINNPKTSGCFLSHFILCSYLFPPRVSAFIFLPPSLLFFFFFFDISSSPPLFPLTSSQVTMATHSSIACCQGSTPHESGVPPAAV